VLPARPRLFGALILLAVGVSLAGCGRRRFGPNDAYLDPRMTAEDWRGLFESDNREIYVERSLILRLAAPRPGMAVVDVGAGTGLFSMMLSDAVRPGGRVYAEEVLPKFSAFIAERAEREHRDNVISVMGTANDVGLPPESVDLAFACDVYHHFAHPAEMLASIRRALRPGGELLVVDFSRDPGQSPQWILDHVRAGEATVVAELERAGFSLLSSNHGLGINYALRLRRQ
jgi:predicted methyltransferase